MKFLFRFVNWLRGFSTEPELDYDPKEIAMVRRDDGSYEVK